jgi:hypothetical protein
MSIVESMHGSNVMQIPQPQSEAAAFIAIFERAIRDPSVDVNKARELYELRRLVRAEEAEASFNEAMSDAQGEMGMVRRDASNPQTRSRYASHAALDHALRPIYSKHGFALSFDTGETPAENMIRIECLVTCAGHTRKYHIDMPADGKGAKGGDVMTRTHATGSAITYGRRYLLLMIFNIAVGDDDGNAAAGNGNDHINPKQIETIQAKIVATGADIAKFCKFFRVETIAELPAARFDNAMKALDQYAAQKRAQ